MQRAEQTVLLQEANQQLIKIRNLEINYFTRNIQNYVGVAAIFVVFSLSSLNNNEIHETTEMKIAVYVYQLAGTVYILIYYLVRIK